MIKKMRTAAWMFRQSKYRQHAFHLVKRMFLPDYDSPAFRKKAVSWAAGQAVDYKVGLATLGVVGDAYGLSCEVIQEGRQLASKSSVCMGGPACLDLLFDAVRLTGSQRIIETGVAYGWSSLAILNAMAAEKEGRLCSVDMPYPKRGGEEFVGIVVPARLKSRWSLIREPDRPGLMKAIAAFDRQIDLCHYDSDKSWWGRAYAFPLLWNALRPGGLFICDDIQDNLYFSEFVTQRCVPYVVTKSDGKYIGVIRKP